jgi:BD-FAE
MQQDDPSSRDHVTRRRLIASAAAGAVAAGGAAHAQQSPQAPRQKGPLVWLDMDQKELDDAYDQLVYAPNRDQILKRCVRNSELVRERLGAPQRFAYGSTPIEALDVFTTRVANAPVNVFIHGGAWRGGLAKNYAYPAEMFVNAGAHYVVLDFINVIEAQGDLMPMAHQVRSAVAWVYKYAKTFGGDPERIHVIPTLGDVDSSAVLPELTARSYPFDTKRGFCVLSPAVPGGGESWSSRVGISSNSSAIRQNAGAGLPSSLPKTPGPTIARDPTSQPWKNQ